MSIKKTHLMLAAEKTTNLLMGLRFPLFHIEPIPEKSLGKRLDFQKVLKQCILQTKVDHFNGIRQAGWSTNYIRKVFDICTRQARSRNWDELGLEMKGKVLRFEVLSEDEWEAKLNKMLAE